MADKSKKSEKNEKPEVAEKKSSAKKTIKNKCEKYLKKIEELEAKVKELEDKNLRTLAEYDNYRKRSYRELTDARSYSKAETLTPILNVFDHFNMAVQAVESADDMNIIKEGMKMISSEFSKALDELGVKELNAMGEQFDPAIHEAVAKEPSEEEEDTVIKQWRCGYKLGERLLRPATVVVSSGPKEEDSEEE